MAAPSDTSELKGLIASGALDPREIVAVIGKTEGNGGANDFTRALATLSFALALEPHLGRAKEAIMSEIAFVWSGGTEGVLSPHATVFTRSNASTIPPASPRLALGLAMTRDIAPDEFGTPAHVILVADAVRQALADADIKDPADVHYVQVKGPLLTPAAIASAKAAGQALVTDDPNGSKPFARGAMALGVAVGLGEVQAEKVTPASIARDMNLYSKVASTSAGGELTKCEIILFGNSPSASSDYSIGHATLKDALDASAVGAAARSANAAVEDIVTVFAKAEASTMLRGRRTTMYSDADINYERHARAAVGAVIASVTGDPAIFLSGGTEHQCPPGEAPIAAIVRARS
ncbi:Cyanuric acid amidohydrolase [Devosia equisanguinis]|uniref:Cyclic amide hydrolase n=2 Tax=Devosia equisanguinis TaxID=2490941 RepID=A0A3S4CPG0_9HYPH|nr:Cyanuric acid amidohydrolase [Devosia equisanguinis]